MEVYRNEKTTERERGRDNYQISLQMTERC